MRSFPVSVMITVSCAVLLGSAAPLSRSSSVIRAQSPAPPSASSPDASAAPTAPPATPRGRAEIVLTPQTLFTDDLPVGFVRTIRTVNTERKEDLVVTTVTTKIYRRPPRPFPKSAIEIPSIRLMAHMVEGISQRAISQGPGHFPGMANPGEPGNCGIAAHSNVPGCAYFRNLHRLRPGARIFVWTGTARYTYVVTNLHVVWPNNVADLRPTPYPRLTLVTCTLPNARQRLIVVAQEENARPSPAPHPAIEPTPAMPSVGARK